MMAFLKQFAAAWSRLCQRRRPNDGLWPQARSPVQSLPGRIWDAPRRHASADADMVRGVVPVPRLMWRGGDRWMISGQFECARPAQLLASNMTLGIDLGVSMPVTAFDGEGFLLEPTAPRKLRKALRRLRRAHRQLSARQKGSARRKAQRIGVNTRKVRERRNNILHQISHLLTAKAAVINGNVHRLQRRLARAAGGRAVVPVERPVAAAAASIPTSQPACFCLRRKRAPCRAGSQPVAATSTGTARDTPATALRAGRSESRCHSAARSRCRSLNRELKQEWSVMATTNVNNSEGDHLRLLRWPN
jgi:Probable transposase